MKVKTILTTTVALVGSVGLHLTGFSMAPVDEVQIQGGAPNQMAMLGNSFADMTEGAISSSTANDVEEPVEQVDETEPVEQTEAEQPVDQGVTETPVNDPQATQTPLPETTNASNEPEPVETPHQATVAALVIAESRSNPVVPLIEKPPAAELEPALQPPVTAVVSPPVARPVAVAPVTPTASRPPGPEVARPPQTLAALTPVTPRETVTAQPQVQVQKATPETVRPVARPPKPAEPVAKPKPAPAPATDRRKGGDQSAKKGQATGSAAGQAARSSTKNSATANTAGNAAVANYPGVVMRKISRLRKERAGVKGKATVGFKISASGAVGSVRILKSSGSAKIDGIAVRHIRRASPFPPPPKGARRSFSVVFVSNR